MIVAPGARDRQAEQAARDGIDTFIPVVRQKAADHLLGQSQIFVIHGRSAQIPERAQIVTSGVGHQVRRELQLDETVVRNVLVDGFDDPVAISPGEWIRRIRRLASRVVFAEAGDIHPVAAPPLAVSFRSEQLVDEFFVRVRRLVICERFDLFVGRLVAHKVDVRAPDEGASVRRREMASDLSP